MRRKFAVAAFIACSACSSTDGFQPDDAEIAKLERKLAASHCVGNLDLWQRAYVRKQAISENETGMFDRRMIEFTLQKVDGEAVSGRKSMKRYEDWAIAGGCQEPDCLFGGYVIPTDELILECEAPPAP
ncbi:hypothetical protein [Sphingopyxis macrogoltabida]|uniref:Uncharacterized protein n=1 Tax=Sphingopyxis macrogoltabida TaxID=33050 RepID=A0A0N9UD93_SPHMC|nr:hypothetical protein [Sphingopyxis macrogoltabida]ALH81362.1 hypothetical protein AN936_13615 [Sphingopyxis macrogoltabida]